MRANRERKPVAGKMDTVLRGGLFALLAMLIHRSALGDVHEEFFLVAGESLREVRADLSRRGPVDDRGVHRDAVTRWTISWRWKLLPTKRIDPESIACRYEAQVLLPSWEGEPKAAPEERAEWRRFLEALRQHEARHVAVARDNYAGVCEVLRGEARRRPLTASEGNEIGRRAIMGLREIDREIDRESDHGRRDGVLLAVPGLLRNGDTHQ